MQHRNLANRYDQLNPRERLQMLIEAKAREDSAEEQLLWQTCPRKSYTQADDDFDRPYEAISRMAVVFTADMYKEVGRLRTLRGVQCMMPLLLMSAAEEGVERDAMERLSEGVDRSGEATEQQNEAAPVVEQSDTSPDPEATTPTDYFDSLEREVVEYLPRTAKTMENILESMRRRSRSRLGGMLKGFDHFSSHAIGVSARTLLQAYVPPLLEHLEEFDVSEVAPDEEYAKDMEMVAWKAWKRLAFRN